MRDAGNIKKMFLLTLVRINIIKKVYKKINAREDVEKRKETSCTVDGNTN